MNRFCLLTILILLPAIGVGQFSCADEQIDLLQLELITYAPSFSHSIILIDCDSSGMKLTLTSFSPKEIVIQHEQHNIPSLSYKEFKATVLPLDVISMKDLSNLYLMDGLETEITFRDRYGNINRFETRVPVVRGRNLYLIEEIIALAKALPISEQHRVYLESLYDNYLIYCRKN